MMNLAVKSRKRARHAEILREFVTNSVRKGKAWRVVHKYRSHLVTCQRHVRSFLRCKRARLAALTRIWHLLEDNSNMRITRDEAIKQLERQKSGDEKAVDDARHAISGLLAQWRRSFRGMRKVVQDHDPAGAMNDSLVGASNLFKVTAGGAAAGSGWGGIAARLQGKTKTGGVGSNKLGAIATDLTAAMRRKATQANTTGYHVLPR